MADAQTAQRQLDQVDAQVLEAVEEDAVARRGDDGLEFVPRKVADQVVDVLGAAARAGRDEEVKHADRSCHGSIRPVASWRLSSPRSWPGRRSAVSGVTRKTAHHHG